MLRKKVTAIAVAAAIGMSAAVVQAQRGGGQGQQAPPQMFVQMVKPGLYAIGVPGSNTIGVRVTGEGVILVDDMVAPNYDGILRNLRTITDQPVKYIINTHHHPDHTGTNARWVESMNPQIWGHRNARAAFVGDRENAPGAMTMTYTDQASIFLGGVEVQMHYFGRGHTRGDTVVYFPDLETVHTGDLFVMLDRPPTTDYANGGSQFAWKQTLRNVLNRLEFDTVIPGHGPVSTRDDMANWIRKLELLQSRSIELIRQGATPEQLIERIQLADLEWVSAETGRLPEGSLWARGIQAFYDEMASAIEE